MQLRVPPLQITQGRGQDATFFDLCNEPVAAATQQTSDTLATRESRFRTTGGVVIDVELSTSRVGLRQRAFTNRARALLLDHHYAKLRRGEMVVAQGGRPSRRGHAVRMVGAIPGSARFDLGSDQSKVVGMTLTALGVPARLTGISESARPGFVEELRGQRLRDLAHYASSFFDHGGILHLQGGSS